MAERGYSYGLMAGALGEALSKGLGQMADVEERLPELRARRRALEEESALAPFRRIITEAEARKAGEPTLYTGPGGLLYRLREGQFEKVPGQEPKPTEPMTEYQREQVRLKEEELEQKKKLGGFTPYQKFLMGVREKQEGRQQQALLRSLETGVKRVILDAVGDPLQRYSKLSGSPTERVAKFNYLVKMHTIQQAEAYGVPLPSGYTLPPKPKGLDEDLGVGAEAAGPGLWQRLMRWLAPPGQAPPGQVPAGQAPPGPAAPPRVAPTRQSALADIRSRLDRDEAIPESVIREQLAGAGLSEAEIAESIRDLESEYGVETPGETE